MQNHGSEKRSTTTKKLTIDQETLQNAIQTTVKIDRIFHQTNAKSRLSKNT